MQRRNDHIGWTDVLFIPGALVLSYVLGRWLPRAVAITLSAVLLLLIFSLFEPRERSIKRLILPILVAAIIIYTLTALFNWPP